MVISNRTIIACSLLTVVGVYCASTGSMARIAPAEPTRRAESSVPQENTAYVWKNVPIGGGGYVLDVVCHPKEKGLVYIRTDVGGCYRWDGANKRWIPITDGFRRDQSNYYGGESLALDPSNPNIVYLAAGKYTADWASKGAIFKSLDRGKTWKKLPLEVKMGSNEDHRTCNPRLVVSPTKWSVLLFGSRRDGLWRSENAGASWSKVDAFPGKPKEGVGITSIAFDVSKPGRVYAAAFGDGVYRSDDYGETWKGTAGSPAEVLRLAATPEGVVFATHEKGIARWVGEQWGDVTPAGASGSSFAGLSVNPRDGREVIATAQKDHLNLYRSRDGGATWTKKNYAVESSVPWYPGHMKQIQYTSGLTFDPQVPGRIWLTDWYATYFADDINADPIKLRNEENGHEELVVFSLAAPPTGLPLVSGVADVDGFPHSSLTELPTRGLGDFYGGSGPSFGDTYQITWCSSEPNYLVRVSGKRWDNTGSGTISTDGGKTWNGFPSWDQKIIPARVAVSATDPKNMVVLRIRSGPALVTRDGGNSWKEVRGLPDNIIHDFWNWQVPLASDGATGGIFYVFADNKLFRSTDNGESFATVCENLPGGGQNGLFSVPGKKNELWLSLDNGGLRHSTDGGVTFAALPTVKQSHLFAAGKNAPGKTTPALYLYGVLKDGKDGIFRSDDNGNNWKAIHDPRVPVGNEPNSMTASWQTFGQVFIGTNGRGIYVGSTAQATLVRPTEVGR